MPRTPSCARSRAAASKVTERTLIPSPPRFRLVFFPLLLSFHSLTLSRPFFLFRLCIDFPWSVFTFTPTPRNASKPKSGPSHAAARTHKFRRVESIPVGMYSRPSFSVVTLFTFPFFLLLSGSLPSLFLFAWFQPFLLLYTILILMILSTFPNHVFCTHSCPPRFSQRLGLRVVSCFLFIRISFFLSFHPSTVFRFPFYLSSLFFPFIFSPVGLFLFLLLSDFLSRPHSNYTLLLFTSSWITLSF